MSMLRLVIVWLGTLASIIGLVVTLWPKAGGLSTGQGVLLGVAIIFVVSVIVLDVRQWIQITPKRYKDVRKINEYMHRWISSGGRVVIFTRDMSWAGDSRIKDLLLNKARAHELSICLPESIPLTDELGEAGASILTYEKLGYIPTARFTIVNDSRMDAQIAIGRRLGAYHVIEEFAAGGHPVFSVAKDLVEIIRRLSGEGRDR